MTSKLVFMTSYCKSYKTELPPKRSLVHRFRLNKQDVQMVVAFSGTFGTRGRVIRGIEGISDICNNRFYAHRNILCFAPFRRPAFSD